MALAGLAGFGSSILLVCFALALGSAAYNFVYGSGSTAAVGYGSRSRTGTSPAGRGYRSFTWSTRPPVDLFLLLITRHGYKFSFP